MSEQGRDASTAPVVTELPVDFSAWGLLDQLAERVSLNASTNNQSHWFGCFRGGWYGMRMRIWGFQCHYYESHSWTKKSGLRLEHEHHLATMLFNMDASIECMVFAANSLGNAFAASDFLDVTNSRELRRVSPANVLEIGKSEIPGYAKHFGHFTTLMRQFEPMIQIIMDHHDVSKHRQINLIGGTYRRDAPPGFYEAHGTSAAHIGSSHLAPLACTLLVQNPKLPLAARVQAGSTSPPHIFERIAELYAAFMSTIGSALFRDASSVFSRRETTA